MEFERKDFYTIEDLLKVVEILRHPEIGCEWDRVQTHLSVRKDSHILMAALHIFQ